MVLQVWEVEGPEAMKVVAELEKEGLADILGHSSSTPRFRVHPDTSAQVAAALIEAGLTYTLVISDLARHVQVRLNVLLYTLQRIHYFLNWQ